MKHTACRGTLRMTALVVRMPAGRVWMPDSRHVGDRSNG